MACWWHLSHNGISRVSTSRVWNTEEPFLSSFDSSVSFSHDTEIPVSWFTDGPHRCESSNLKKNNGKRSAVDFRSRNNRPDLFANGNGRMCESQAATMIERIVTNVNRPDIANVRSRSVRRKRATRRNWIAASEKFSIKVTPFFSSRQRALNLHIVSLFPIRSNIK